ncbi:MAG: molybdopterin-synthase adenylyltransferase MoeB [Acidobacteria bacterium]|nr:molybdopterin-synthase adenylyltransferase MoeB [Acidobacteriota bacterium]
MKLSYHGLVDRLRAQVPEISTADLAERLDAPPILIDIREPQEIRSGVIPGSHPVPRGVLEGAIWQLSPDPNSEIVLICDGGNRTILSATSLQAMGFTNVSSLAGGTTKWRKEGRPLTVPGAATDTDVPMLQLSADEESRYARHLVLEGVGHEGQQRLASAAALIVGIGGLGSPVGLYLAAAGVGRIGLVDPDVVDVTNLQRQVIHDTSRLGERKVDSAATTIRHLNPGVTVDRHPVALQADNVLDVLGGYDIVIDATDNFPTRYLLNDASLHLRIPVVHGSVYKFEGQASLFRPYAGPCYRCLFPQPPPPEFAPNCAEVGVLGVLPGTIGMIQATETVKVILDLGETLQGRLLTYDALTAEFETLPIRRDPSCPACSDEDRPPTLVDYDDMCVPAAR